MCCFRLDQEQQDFSVDANGWSCSFPSRIVWMFDLSVMQQMQDQVSGADRCIVGGVQNSLQSMFDLLTYIMVPFFTGVLLRMKLIVGMGATLLDGVVVEKHGMVAAGSLVRQNTRIPCGEVWAGNPAKFLRNLTEEEIALNSQSAVNYVNLAEVHAAENEKSFDEIEFEKALRKKFARRVEEYDSMLGVVREAPPELILPDNILPGKALKPSQ